MKRRLNKVTPDASLAWLIHPVRTDDFLSDYFENKPLLIQPEDPDRYSDLISVDQIDKMIASTELPPRTLQMARQTPPVYTDDFCYEDGVIDRTGVLREYQRGATLILPQLQHRHAGLKAFCMALEAEFSCHVQTNIYLTPPNNQGFSSHYDNHDVFVMQVSGRKRWRIYEKPLYNPYRGEAFNSQAHKPGNVAHEFILEPGECVYIPRGWMHDAESLDEAPSLHITVGLITKTWADLMLESLSEFALRDAEFRQSLPVGFAREDDRSHPALQAKMKQRFSHLVTRFADNANFEDTFELFLQNFLRTRDTNTRSSLAQAFSSDNQNMAFRKRHLAQCVIRDEGANLLLICAAGDLRFDHSLESGIDKMMSGGTFDKSDFHSADDADIEDTIQRLLASGVIETV